MDHKSLIDYVEKYDIKDKEDYLIKRVKAVNKSQYPFRTYNKKMWVNALAEFYFNEGFDVGKIGLLISEKTNINYTFIAKYLDSKYKHVSERLETLKPDIISFYTEHKNLKMAAETFSTTPISISQKLSEWGIEKGPWRTQFRMKEIKKTPKKLSFLELGKIYRLQSSWCDYFYHDRFGNNCTVIEEKQTLSKYNYGTAATQLIIGKKIIEENTSYKIDHMIILAYKIKLDTKNKARLLNIITDYSKYLDIDLVIPSL